MTVSGIFWTTWNPSILITAYSAVTFWIAQCKKSVLVNGRKGSIMEFYETKQGRIFYEGTLPRIVVALEKIAGSLSAPTPSLRIAHEVPEDFLTDLYWGNFDPSGGPDSEESAQCSAEIKAAQETVKSQVKPEVWEQIDNVFSLISRRSDIDRAEAYAAGFRSAATMLAAGMSKPCRKEVA